MSKKGEPAKQGDNAVPDTSGDKADIQALGSHSSMGPVKMLGDSAGGRRRMSSYGTFNRVVMIAIDASPIAMYAFHCKWTMHALKSSLSCIGDCSPRDLNLGLEIVSRL